MTKFAYRLETKRVKEPDFPYMGKFLTHPEAVAEFCRSLQVLSPGNDGPARHRKADPLIGF